jgi:2-oxoglutarate dehydrogenase E1 component
MNELHDVLEGLDPEKDFVEPIPRAPPPGAARSVATGVPIDRLREINTALLRLPDGFSLHRKIERVRSQRQEVLSDSDESTVDWATAEELALATILADGVAVRLTGEDSERGTFSQRHAVFHDVETGETYTLLQSFSGAHAAFEIHNSPLSELATIGFEYGYNVQEPERLVIWEAQYGDFINNAQVMVDEFISSARAKWGQTPSLVLLLPHALEGAGPDHSSGRLERFLSLAAQTNLRIAYPTSATQYFHLLRRQAVLLKTDPLPLIVMTPKSLLRHPRVASTPRELAEDSWRPVIDDPRAGEAPEAVTRLILCSGKVGVDLLTSEHRESSEEIAIVRLEQLYPPPADGVKALLDAYPDLQEVCWVQEEPQNMGAWRYLLPRLQEWIDGRWALRYIGRPPNASPAEGSSAWFHTNQTALIARAFERQVEEGDVALIKTEQKIT